MTIETANRLVELRKKNNLSQEELAEKLGVSRQAVSKWERSEASPDTDNLIALAKIYGLTLDELVFGVRQTEEKAEEPQKGTNKVDIGPMGIFVESDDGDKVQINLKGIKVTESAKEKYENSGVKIDLGGIKIGSSADFDFSEDFDFSKDFDDNVNNLIHCLSPFFQVLFVPIPSTDAIIWFGSAFSLISSGRSSRSCIGILIRFSAFAFQ